MMKWIGIFLKSFWGELLIGAVIFCLLIWFFGPMLGIGSFHPFASHLERIITIVVVVMLWVILSLWH